jgi:hypothetical protein
LQKSAFHVQARNEPRLRAQESGHNRQAAIKTWSSDFALNRGCFLASDPSRHKGTPAPKLLAMADMKQLKTSRFVMIAETTSGDRTHLSA